jgi:tetratricopeptide (TPR) repeat protein
LDNLYSILEIDPSANEKEIKNAYVKMIRKYPPEKAPEQFKKIREAYEILINPLRRAEYEARSEYGDKIDNLENLAEELMENERYEEAIIQYKKILIIEPSLSLQKNKLALALVYNGQIDEGIKQFKELVILNPQNPMYLGNLAFAYKAKGEFDKAEEYCIKSLEIDGENEQNITLISDIYIEKKEYNKGVEYLRKTAELNRTTDFREFTYYYDIVCICIFSEEINIIEETLTYIEKRISNNEEIKKYILWKFYNLAKSLYKMGDYEYAQLISKKTIETCGHNEKLTKLNEEVTRLVRITLNFDNILKDDRIKDILKTPIYFYLYRFKLSNSQYEKGVKENMNEIKNAILLDAKAVFDSLCIIKKDYSALYELKEDLYDEISDKASSRNSNEGNFKIWD